MIKDGALTDKDIRALLSEGVKIVEPFDDNSLQPASIDLRLGDTVYIYNMENYILGEEIDDSKVKKENFKKRTLNNGEIAYVGLYEKVAIPQNIIGLVMPRSSITRLGISITPIYVNPGYKGQMPLTIINNSGNDVTLKPMTRVVQLILFSLSGSPAKAYGSATDAKYLNEKVDYSKLHLDEEIKKAINTVIEREAPDLFNKIKDKIKDE